MKWKPEVILTDQDGPQLCMTNRQIPLAPKDVYLAKAMLQGEHDIDWLKELMMETEGIDETAAAFGLAQFILNYGDFIADDTTPFMMIN